MIIELESNMTKERKLKRKVEWFPPYIVVRQRANETQGNDPMREFVREIKNSLESIDKSQKKSLEELKKAQEDSKELMLKEIKIIGQSIKKMR